MFTIRVSIALLLCISIAVLPCLASDSETPPPNPSPDFSQFDWNAAVESAMQAQTGAVKSPGYGHGFFLRRKIHRYASYATLPLFAAQFAVGEKLYDDPSSDSLRSAHSALVGGTAALFAINSVTGIWNWKELRKNRYGKGRRDFHSYLMLAADAGFIATAATAPGHHESEDFAEGGNRGTHRALGFASMGVATVSYIYMLLAK